MKFSLALLFFVFGCLNACTNKNSQQDNETLWFLIPTKVLLTTHHRSNSFEGLPILWVRS